MKHKTCIFCGETIDSNNSKCPYCNEDLESNMEKSTVQESWDSNATKTGNIDNVSSAAIGQKAQSIQAKEVDDSIVQSHGNIRDVITTTTHIYNQEKTEEQTSCFQVNRLPLDYVPREEIESNLYELLLDTKGKLHTINLFGWSGVGKSLLGRSIATKVKQHFPDGILWANVEAMSIEDILKKFIAPFELSTNRNLLYERAEYLEILQRILSDKRVLIILDQVKSASDISHLLPTSCPQIVILIISTEPINELIYKQNQIRLPEMTEDEAEKLFRNIWKESYLSTTSKLIHEIAEHLYFIPASMALIAQDILSRRISPSESLENLKLKKQEKSISTKLNPGFDLVYENLPEESKQILPFLGVMGGGVWTADVLSTISRRKINDVQTGLNQLISTFIDKVSSIYFRCKPVVQDFALAKLQEIGGDTLVSVSRTLRAYYYLNLLLDRCKGWNENII